MNNCTKENCDELKNTKIGLQKLQDATPNRTSKEQKLIDDFIIMTFKHIGHPDEKL